MTTSTASPASCKVQKPGRRQGSVQHVPENIARALESMPVNIKFEDTTSENQTGLSSYPLDHNGFNLNLSSNGAYRPSSTPQEPSYPPQRTNESSCCSKKPPPPPVVPSTGGSCCSGKSSSQSTTPLVPNVPGFHEQPTAWNNTSYSGFAPTHMAWHDSMASTQPSAQSQIVPHYGLPEHHVPPAYVNGFSQNGTSAYTHSANGLGIAQSSMPSYASTPSQSSAYTPNHVGGDPSHDCQCGEECQCLGCAAHPFNNTTRQRVQEMGEMMTIGGDKPSFEPYHSPPFQGTQNWERFNYLPQGLDHGIPQNSFDPYSDQPHIRQPPTFTSTYSSPVPNDHVMNEQLMHTSEYYTLEYPVGIPSACSDVTGSCQCGNDCSCVGCLTHSGHNGVSLGPPLQDATLPSHSIPEHLVSPGEQVTPTTSSVQTSRVPALENLSVPCLSPRTLETSMI